MAQAVPLYSGAIGLPANQQAAANAASRAQMIRNKNAAEQLARPVGYATEMEGAMEGVNARMAKAAAEIASTPGYVSGVTNLSYGQGNTNLRLPVGADGCTPCEVQILGKLDILLDRSKPSTAVSNALASGKKTVQSALDAVTLGLGEAAAAGKAGLGVAGAAVLAGASRVGKAAAAASKKMSGDIAAATARAGSELENAARIARNCIKGSATGSNRSVKCAAAYAAVQAAAGKLRDIITCKECPPLTWPEWLTFPKFKYFTVRNNKGKSQFNRNVNRSLGAIGRFGSRVATGLGAFGSRVRNVTGRAARAVRNTAGKGAGAVSRAMYRLSGREQADMIKQLLLDSMALKNQGKLTGRAVAELQAAMKAAQPGVVTADVVAEAAKVGANLGYAPGATNLKLPLSEQLRRLNTRKNMASSTNLVYAPGATNLVKPVANAKFGNAAAASPVMGANNKARAAAAFGEQFAQRAPPGAGNGLYSGGRKGSRKNRKSSRKSSRKNRKSSRKN